jgi:hypothetical protein
MECSTLKIFKALAASAAISAALCAPGKANESAEAVNSSFEIDGEFAFTADQKTLIDDVLEETHARVADVFLEVADQVNVVVIPVQRPAVDPLGGVTGRTERPNEIIVEFSQTYPHGIEGAVRDGLAATFVHELHHTIRGWTLNGNHYGYGIQIAVINEGLATVFAEELLGEVKQSDLPPADVKEWVDEVLALPSDAVYGEWMFLHPDGREAIGYRTGRWVVRRAMERSGLDIVELTDLTPTAIWQRAGYDWDRQLQRHASNGSTEP